MSAPIVVSGLGCVGGWGIGRGELARALAGPPPALSEVDLGAGYHRPGGGRQALLAAGLDLSRWVPPRQARRMSPPSRHAVVALRLAIEDAGLTADDPGWADTAVITGTAFGPAWITEQLLRSIQGPDGPETASPAYFTESVANASAAQMALAVRARGPNLTVTGRDASDLQAVEQALRLIRCGQARRVLVGVVDEMTPLLHAVLERFGALSRGWPRPFAADRDGQLAAEGAAVLVLEDEAQVRARGARPLLEVRGAASAFDPSAPPHGWGSGAPALAAAVRSSLDRWRADLSAIDVVLSGASGSRGGDRLEAQWLGGVFEGRELPPLLCPKGVVGAWGGGFLAAAVLLAGGVGTSARLPAVGSPDRDLGVVPATELPRPPATALATSLAPGGNAAWALLGAPRGRELTADS